MGRKCSLFIFCNDLSRGIVPLVAGGKFQLQEMFRQYGTAVQYLLINHGIFVKLCVCQNSTNTNLGARVELFSIL